MNTSPRALKEVHSVIANSLALSQEMVSNMMKDNGELSERHVHRFLDVGAVGENGEIDAQALAEVLVYSQSPLLELQNPTGQHVTRNKATAASALVVQAALAEQQDKSGCLRSGVNFKANVLFETLVDWIYRGAHRQSCEDAPLTAIAKIIDTTSVSDVRACETRFGCVIPVVVSVLVLAHLQSSMASMAESVSK